jgi:hypothetical protein
MRAHLDALRLEKEAIVANRQQREKEYAEQREREWQEALERDRQQGRENRVRVWSFQEFGVLTVSTGRQSERGKGIEFSGF